MPTRPVIVNQLSPEIGAVLVAHPSRPRVIDDIKPEEPWRISPEADILVTGGFAAWRNTPREWPFPEKLAWTQVQSTGVEVYPHALIRHGTMTCGRGLNAVPIAEFVMAAILRIEKRLNETRARGAADWQTPSIGRLYGRTLGLIGYGTIGQAIARRAQAFDMKVIVNRRGSWDKVPDGITPSDSPAEVVANADHLVLAAPLTAETSGMVDAALLARAKPGLHLVNISRGGLVDQAALLSGLDVGTIGHATLDVTTPEPLPDGHPLYSDGRVFISPHISWAGGDQDRLFLERLLENLDGYLAGRPLRFRVDPVAGY